MQSLTCAACPANTFFLGGVCAACSGDTVSVAGSAACQCKPGFTGTPGACQACPAGTYKRMAGTSACRSCQANSVSASGSALCACAPGYTGQTGEVCVACVAGKYKNVSGSAACVDCAGMRNSPAAALNVTSCVCNVGYTQVENAAMTFDVVYARACVACAPGTFKALTGVQACTLCAQNQSSVAGMTVCSCVAGFTGPDGGPCAECARGTYKDWLGPQACAGCPWQTNTAGTGSALLRNCTCNTGYVGPDGVACVQCAAGTYKNVTGSALCSACPSRTMSSMASTSIERCQCMPSFAGPDGGPCGQCPSGQYKNWPNSSCAPCSANSDSTEGSTLCKCDTGSTEVLGYTGITANNGDQYDLLQACGANENERCKSLGCGTDAPIYDPASTNRFNDNDYTTRGGIPVGWGCRPGGWTVSALPIDFGREKIVTSVVVYWRRDVGGDCPNHFCGAAYTVRVGNTPPGWSPETNNELLCPASTPSYTSSPRVWINGVEFVKFIVDCGSTLRGRYFTINRGITSWSGTTMSVTEMQVMGFKESMTCASCAAGKYKNGTGTAACTTCPANSYEPDAGATLETNCSCNAGYEGADGGPCLACALGKYKDTNGTAPCVSCPVDTYMDVQGSAFCKACPKFTTSPVGSTSIYSCSCVVGYTYDAGADIADPLSTVLATSPAYLMTSAEAWDAANSRFTDLSGNGHHGALTAGTVTVGSVTGNGAGWSIPFVQGAVSTTIKWDPGSIPSTFTVCSITRYTGGVRQRVLDGGDFWSHGHFGGAGGIYYQQMSGNTGSVGHKISVATDWVIACGRNTASGISTIVNGVVTSFGAGGRNGYGRLVINDWGEKSDWQLSRVYVWNRHLTDAEFAEASAKLNSYVDVLRMPSYYLCSSCQPGKYKDTIGSALCTSCAANTYSATSVACTSCVACQGNSTSLIGSASKDYCQCNTGFLHAGEGCAECMQGTFNPRLGQTACSNCTVGTYSLNYGATSNETCASCSGTEYSPEGSPLCTSCPPNSVAPARSGRIQDCGCTLGYTGPTASACEQCAPGTFKNISGNWLCQSCSPNSYSLSGATALTQCFCNPGYTGAFGPLCVACALGKYKSEYGNSTCIDCPANTYADQRGMTACTSCVAASAAPVGSVTIWNCTCNAGYKGPTYEEVVSNQNFVRSCGGSACVATQSSTLTAQIAVGVFESMNPAWMAADNSSTTFAMTAYGTNQWWRVDFGRRVTVQSVRMLFSTFAIDVLHVHVGDVPSSTGNVICASIAVDTSSSDWVSAKCASALTGRYLYVRNSIASQVALMEVQAQGTEVLTRVFPEWCAACPVGTYKPASGNLECTKCPSNMFSASVAATNISTCIRCGANSVAPTGSEQCACDVGFSGPPDACTVCPSEQFKTQVGSSTCDVCPANSVIAANASRAVMPCTCLSGFEPR